MEPIISRDLIRAKAREAFCRGKDRDDHGFNWHCREAIETWQAEWDRQSALWASQQKKQQETGMNEHPTDCICISCAPISTPTRSPSLNDALAGKHGLDVAQAVALLVSLGAYGQKVAVCHLRALNGLQGQMG